MGQTTRDCWQCDVCGFTWLKGEALPVNCASSKCRTRRWNEMPRSRSKSAVAYSVQQAAELPEREIVYDEA